MPGNQPITYAIQLLDLNNLEEVARFYNLFAALRPHLDRSEFLRRVTAQKEEGYQIAFIEIDGEPCAAAGCRIAHFLAWGKVLYIDDLITLPAKTRLGLGGALLDWTFEQARLHGCDEVHLDSGYQRHDAHRLYLNKGMKLVCHHFSAAASQSSEE